MLNTLLFLMNKSSIPYQSSHNFDAKNSTEIKEISDEYGYLKIMTLEVPRNGLCPGVESPAFLA